MSTFGPIAYEDFSQLNARWGEARPPVAGLGGMAWSGQHDYVDLSFLNARLRPIQPAGVGMGNGILSGNNLGIAAAGLGADPTYPWREYSADTKALQQATNEALRARGYAPITEDGKLGPVMCTAIRKMCSESGQDCDAPSTCQSFGEDPVKLSSSTTAKRTTTTKSAGMAYGGGTDWMLVGGAVAAIAVGSALIYKAMKK